MTPGELLRDARRRHRVTQKQLAARARTSQAAISRIERDTVSPSVAPADWGHDVTLIHAKLERTPAQRVADNVAYARFARAVRHGT